MLLCRKTIQISCGKKICILNHNNSQICVLTYNNSNCKGEYMTSDTGASLKILAHDGNFDLGSVEHQKKVTRIGKKSDKFVLTFSDDSKIEADYCICTVPISMYKSGKIEIDFLPQKHKELFESISFVNFANCWVLIDESDERGINQNMFHYLPTRYESELTFT